MTFADLRVWLAAVSSWGVVAALLSALALLLVWPAPAGPPSASSSGLAMPRWLVGRADAAPLPRRLLYGGLLGIAGVGLLLRFGVVIAVTGALVPGSRWRRRAGVAGAGCHPVGPTTPDRGRSSGARPARVLPGGRTSRPGGVAHRGRGGRRSAGDDLAQVLRLTDLGHDDVSAWRTLARHDQLGPAALDLARSVETGSLLVESLLVHAEVAREDRHGQVEAAARRVGVRSVMPLMVCFIPSFLLIGIVPTVASAIVSALHF